ncbi:MAG: ATP-binding cassette domain-containing protein, partial [Baekduiaceae bacterium]
VSVLSGGERRRLALAVIVASGENLLVLDEPTNHLDLESREALEAALDAFPGTVLLVSHDRALLDAVGTRTVALEDQRLHSYIGGWPEYVRVREERKAAPPKAKAPAPAPKAKSQPPSNGNGQPKVSKNEKKRLQTLEREIEQAEAALAKLEEELAAPDAWDTPDKSAENTERHTAAKRAVEEAYARWEAASA